MVEISNAAGSSYSEQTSLCDGSSLSVIGSL